MKNKYVIIVAEIVFALLVVFILLSVRYYLELAGVRFDLYARGRL